MKKRKAKALKPLAPVELAGNFTRGMVATGLLTAIQNRSTVGTPPSREIVRLALQGGVALAAGIATAESMRDRDYLGALIAVAGGALGVMAAETLLASETLKSTEEAEIG